MTLCDEALRLARQREPQHLECSPIRDQCIGAPVAGAGRIEELMSTATEKRPPAKLVADTVSALATAERFVRLQGLVDESRKIGRLRERWANRFEPRERR